MRNILKADDGYVYTDGEIYGTKIYLAEGKSAEDFYLITVEEYNIRMEEATEEENGLTKEDCLEALAMLGVE